MFHTHTLCMTGPCQHPNQDSDFQICREYISIVLSTRLWHLYLGPTKTTHHTQTWFLLLPYSTQPPQLASVPTVLQKGLRESPVCGLVGESPLPHNYTRQALSQFYCFSIAPSCLLWAPACPSTIQVPDTLSHWVELGEREMQMEKHGSPL